jgi:hypothetical protein
MFCVAYGLSMDYEVFVLAHIKEEHDRFGEPSARSARASAAPPPSLSPVPGARSANSAGSAGRLRHFRVGAGRERRGHQSVRSLALGETPSHQGEYGVARHRLEDIGPAEDSTYLGLNSG